MIGTLSNLKLVEFLEILALASKEKADRLRWTFRKFSQNQQLIIVYEYLDGLETSEIACKLDLTEQEVQFQRQEALSELGHEI